MEFRIYQDGAGTAAYNGGTYASPTGLDWSEAWLDSNSQGVVVKNGYFSVQLGTLCSLSGGACSGSQSYTNAGVNWNDNTLWLSISIAGGSNATTNCGTTQAAYYTTCTASGVTDGEMLPMRRLDTSVYTESANLLDGIASTGFIQNTASVQSNGANIDYVSAATGNIGAQIQSAASGTAAVMVLKDNTSSTGDLLQMQNSSGTAVARFDDNGNLYAGGTIDTAASGGTLSIAPTNATAGVTFSQNTSVASGKTFTVTAGATTATGVSTGTSVALAVHTGADTNKGLALVANSGTQSADLLDLYNYSGGSLVGAFDKSGVITMNGNIKSGTTAAVGKLIVADGNANGYTGTLLAQNQAETYSLTLPTDGTTGSNCLQSTSGSTGATTVLQWATCGGGTFANQSLSNLTSPTAINQDLTFAAANHKLNITQAASGAGNNLSLVAGEGASGSTGGNLTLQGGANGTAAGTPGSVDVKANGGDSTSAFEVQEAGSTHNPVTVDSTGITTTGGGSLSSWTTDTHNMTTANAEGASTSYNGYIYYLGGEDTTFSPVATVEYAPVSSSTGALTAAWATTTSIPPTSAANTGNCSSSCYDTWVTGCSVAYNGYIYFIDGYDDNNLVDTNVVYYASINANGTINAWGTTTNTPEFTNYLGPGQDSSACIVANGYLYLVGGEAGSSGTSTNEYEYAKLNANGTLGTWTQVTTNLIDSSTGVNAAAIATDGSYLYVAGGDYFTGSTDAELNTTYSATLNSSTGAVGTWSAGGTLGSAVAYANMALANNTLYIAGGQTSISGTTNINTTYKAAVSSGSIGSWSNASDNLPTNQSWGGYTNINGYFYVIDGVNGTTSLKTTYYAQLPGGAAVTNGQGTATIEGALQIQTTAGATLFNVSPTANTVSIGSGSAATDSTAVLLVLDNQASSVSADPTEVNGAMYYNSSLGTFRCGQGGAWVTCVNGAVGTIADTKPDGTGSMGPVINDVYVTPIYIPGVMTVNDLYCQIDIALGAAGDIGLYNSSGSLVLDGGASSLTTATGLKTVAPQQTGSARVLPPGQYYEAVTYGGTTSSGDFYADALTANFYKYNGLLSSGGGTTLPSSITLSSITTNTTMVYMGISN